MMPTEKQTVSRRYNWIRARLRSSGVHDVKQLPLVSEDTRQLVKTITRDLRLLDKCLAQDYKDWAKERDNLYDEIPFDSLPL